MKTRVVVPLLALAALAGCAVYLPEPDAMMAGGDEGRLSDLRAGRQLYINKCSGCHALIPVDKFDDAKWTAEVEEMVRLKKVKLSVEDRNQILLYLTTANDRPQ
jgi:mono/diheme cytochrome c family protein